MACHNTWSSCGTFMQNTFTICWYICFVSSSSLLFMVFVSTVNVQCTSSCGSYGNTNATRGPLRSVWGTAIPSCQQVVAVMWPLAAGLHLQKSPYLACAILSYHVCAKLFWQWDEDTILLPWRLSLKDYGTCAASLSFTFTLFTKHLTVSVQCWLQAVTINIALSSIRLSDTLSGT